MNVRKLFLVLAIFLAYACSTFADTINENHLPIDSFLSSNRVVNNKVYLMPGMVYMAPNQILLNMEGDFLPIENLSADSEGVFVTIDEIVIAAEKRTWRCNGCRRVNSMEDRYCTRCGRSWND